jgi:hypothetical protein
MNGEKEIPPTAWSMAVLKKILDHDPGVIGPRELSHPGCGNSAVRAPCHTAVLGPWTGRGEGGLCLEARGPGHDQMFIELNSLDRNASTSSEVQAQLGVHSCAGPWGSINSW